MATSRCGVPNVHKDWERVESTRSVSWNVSVGRKTGHRSKGHASWTGASSTNWPGDGSNGEGRGNPVPDIAQLSGRAEPRGLDSWSGTCGAQGAPTNATGEPVVLKRCPAS